MILIVCRLPDPHVEAVCTHLDEHSSRYTIWDLNVPSRIRAVWRSSASESQWPFKTIWWRYKATPEEYAGTPTRALSFESREWLAFLRGMAALTDSTSRWVNNPVTTARATYKLYSLTVAARLGLRIPPTCITNAPGVAARFADRRATVYKALTYYFEEPDFAVFTSPVKARAIRDFAVSVARAPVQLQEYVEKEYELRVTVVGNKLFAVKIESQGSPSTTIDWRRNQLRPMYSILGLTNCAAEQVLRLHRELGLVYAAYDFVVDKRGQLVFLEVNPGGQWLWLERITHVPISAAIARLLRAAAEKTEEAAEGLGSVQKS